MEIRWDVFFGKGNPPGGRPRRGRSPGEEGLCQGSVLAGGAVERLHFHSLSRCSAPSWRPRGRAMGIPVLAMLEGEGVGGPVEELARRTRRRRRRLS